MIVINYDATHVSIDGIVEPKIYRARPYSNDKIQIEKIYNKGDYQEPELFSNITIDGVTYGTQEETIEALNLVVYSGVGGDVSIIDENGTPVNPINPLPVSLDIIYENDIDWENSDFTGWVGNPRDLFGNVNNGGIYNDSVYNPKSFTLRLIRTRQARTFAIGANIGNFSNLKATFLGSGDQPRGILDLSEEPIKITSASYGEEEYLFNAIRVEFLTTDRIDLSNIFIEHTESDKKQDYVIKWGANSDVDASTVETIWSLGGVYTFTTTPQSYYISSSSASDTSQEIMLEVIYINQYGRYQREDVSVVLNGQTKILIPSNGLCVASNRAYNNSGNPLIGDIYIYEDTAVNGGVPSDLSKVRSVIKIGREQTEQAVYTVPEFIEDNRKVLEAEIYSWNGAALKNKDTSGAFGLYVAPIGKVARIQSADALNDARTSGETFTSETPLKVPAGSDVFINVEELTQSGVQIKAGFIIKLIVL